MVLGQFPIFAEIDRNLGQAEYFVVSFEGVALFSSTNYCYAVYLFEDYQLGSLTVANEVALVGGYFCQRYCDRYTFKVDMEKIPGQPGQTTVAVGTGGVAVAHTSGTPDQHNFRSYIFTKKNNQRTKSYVPLGFCQNREGHVLIKIKLHINAPLTMAA